MAAIRISQLRSQLSVNTPSRALRIPLAGSPTLTSHRWNSSSSSSISPTRPCPSCSAPLPLPASPCPSCSKLVPIPTGLSHHSLFYLSQPVVGNAAFSSPFDLPSELSKLPAYGYDLDVKDLRTKMLRRQMELHPDKYSGREEEVKLARELSGRVNGAYETLRDPLRRAEYLVSRSTLPLILDRRLPLQRS
jgi:molecular chaperone HscB